MNCYVRLACSMCFQLTNAVQCARLTPPTSEQGALTCSGCNQKRSHCDAWLSPTKHTEISDCFLFANDNDNHGSVGHKISALVYSTYVCCERLLVHFLKLGHDWMFAVFALITAPDWAQLNSTSSEIFRILRLAKNSLICRHFQLGSVGRNRKPDHIASGAVIMLTTEPNWRVGVSCSQLCSVVLSFKPVGRCDCDRGSIRFDRICVCAYIPVFPLNRLWSLSSRCGRAVLVLVALVARGLTESDWVASLNRGDQKVTVSLILVAGGRVVARRRAMFVRHGTVAGSRDILVLVAGRRTIWNGRFQEV